jgi:hypothetical protein
MEAIGSSETSVNICQITQHHIPEDVGIITTVIMPSLTREINLTLGYQADWKVTKKAD